MNLPMRVPAIRLAPLPKPAEEGIDGGADFYSAYSADQMIQFRAAGIAATLAPSGVVPVATAPWP